MGRNRMSAASTFFAVYLAVGLLLVVVAVAAPGRERRTRGLVGAGGDELSAALLFFIAVLWPLWLVWLLVKEDDRER